MIKNFKEFLFESNDISESLQTNIIKLQKAINNKFICIIDYRGEVKGSIENGIRYIEPYVLGTNAIGNTVIRAWMIKGVSRLGKINPDLVPGWRLYRVDRIFDIDQTLEYITEPKEGYNPKDLKMSDIITSIKF